MMLRQSARLLALLAVLLPGAALAHKPSDSYLRLTVGDSHVEGRWDIALRDLDHAIGLDGDGDGAITWGELRVRHGAIASYALARLSLWVRDGACAAVPTAHLVEQHSDGAYAVMTFSAACQGAAEALGIGYGLFFDLDPSHRGLVQVDRGGVVESNVLSPERDSWSLGMAGEGVWMQALTYLREGVWHIWIGFDHVLFLLSLLLPAVLRREGDAWRPVASLGAALGQVVKIVTAFTFAHSLTLGLAALGWLELPGRLIEPVIAASIAVAALNNVYPVVTRGLWALAVAFGLIHGLGFAGALQALGLPSGAQLLALISFNAGVELGQLAIVAVFLPLAYWFSRTRLYPPLVLRAGSLAIAGLAAAWTLERVFGA